MLKIKKVKKSKKNFISKPSLTKDSTNEYFTLSLKHLDKTQGESFSDWEKKLKLSKLLDTIYGYSSEKLINIVDKKKFTIYGDFPPTNKTKFKHPIYVQEDDNWARIHIDGTHCLIGHVIENIFYAVFLDGNHSFWKSKLKNT